MAKRVPEIEPGANPGFALVLHHNLGLDFTRAPDRMGQRRCIPRQQSVQIGFQPDQKFHVVDKAVLDDFGETGTEFAFRQSIEG